MEPQRCCDDLAIILIEDVVEIGRAGLRVIEVPQKLGPVCGRMTEADQASRQLAEESTELAERLGCSFYLGHRHAGYVRHAAHDVLIAAHHERAKRIVAPGRNQAGYGQVRSNRSEMRKRRTLQIKIAFRFGNVRYFEYDVTLPGPQPNILIPF